MSTLTIRTDADVERALAVLTADGRSKSEAVRAAILDAERAVRHGTLQTWAASVANDPDDLAEIQSVRAEMDAIRAW